MTECQSCGGKANNAFLCQRCTSDVRTTLREMPWWLNRLTETALGQTRMSDNGGRKSARRKDLDGDAELAALIEPLPPGEDDLDKARRAREKASLAHALATGGINARASALLGEIGDSLAYWCRVLCEARGVTYTVMGTARSFGANHASWLAINVDAIAASACAGDIVTDINGHADDIIEAVNRPIPVRGLGRCPTWVEDRNGACGRGLWAPADALEVFCNKCKTTHSVHRLLLARFDEACRLPMDWERLNRVNRMQPEGYQVPPRTLRHWRSIDALKSHGEDSKGDPLYLWADVRVLRIAKPQKVTTGASAHLSH